MGNVCINPCRNAEGGLDKIKEAGTLLLGGHSVEDDEFKYGFSGTGIINTAIKGLCELEEKGSFIRGRFQGRPFIKNIIPAFSTGTLDPLNPRILSFFLASSSASRQ